MANDQIRCSRVSDGKTLLQEATPRVWGRTKHDYNGTSSLSFSLELSPDERIYGLGQHQTDHLEQTGSFQTSSYLSLSISLSLSLSL